MSDRFIAEKGSLIQAQCNYCKLRGARATCTAFPRGIPKAILSNQHDHRTPFAEDQGVRFDPVSDEAARSVDALFAKDGGDA